MKLGSKSRALLKEAHVKVGAEYSRISVHHASSSISEQECYELALSLRVAASLIEEIGGRIFYAKGNKK